MSILVSRRRATFGSWLIVIVLTALCIWLFAQITWVSIILSLGLLVILLWQADLMLRTVYTIDDSSETGTVLTIRRGHYGKAQTLRMTDIVEVTYEKSVYGMWRYLLLTTADGRLLTLQPVNPKTWLAVIQQYITRQQ